MVNVEICSITANHIVELAQNLREADLIELGASTRNPPFVAITKSVKLSTSCWACLVEGKVALLFGVGPASILCNVGIPWMLGTPLIEENTFILLRKYQHYLVEMKASYSTLVNYVDARNTKSIKWLKWMGFHVEPVPEPVGIDGQLFHKFELYRELDKCVHQS